MLMASTAMAIESFLADAAAGVDLPPGCLERLRLLEVPGAPSLESALALAVVVPWATWAALVSATDAPAAPSAAVAGPLAGCCFPATLPAVAGPLLDPAAVLASAAVAGPFPPPPGGGEVARTPA